MYAEGNPAELVTQAAGGVEDGENVDDQKTKEQLIKQIVNQLSAEKTAAHAGHDLAQVVPSQVVVLQPPFTDEDSSRWAAIGKLCKDIQFHNRETDRKENALIKLIEGTPLEYSFSRVVDHVRANSPASAPSNSSGADQGSQQPDAGVSAPEE